jgi:hypothetical protein
MQKYESGARMMLTVGSYLRDPAGTAAMLKEALDVEDLAFLERLIPQYADAPDTLLTAVLSDAYSEIPSSRMVRSAG